MNSGERETNTAKWEPCGFKLMASWVPDNQSLFCNRDKAHDGEHSFTLWMNTQAPPSAGSEAAPPDSVQPATGKEGGVPSNGGFSNPSLADLTEDLIEILSLWPPLHDDLCKQTCNLCRWTKETRAKLAHPAARQLLSEEPMRGILDRVPQREPINAIYESATGEGFDFQYRPPAPEASNCENSSGGPINVPQMFVPPSAEREAAPRDDNASTTPNVTTKGLDKRSDEC